ncbi:multicopper oxidase [Bacillus sp. CLL-7-23]|uniref:Multicopper oxidase n=1 Tax=Bacillus changyiensis TaxID=3004103 RepID=A0ABT4X3F6_9BACI|nr:multicopper oxidase [Bacillus changyiensis]MDA7026818.1 multicopper oxidase [Bacillus changyiensis]
MELEKFVDPLPIPEVLIPHERMGSKTYYEVTMKECYQKLHRDLPPTRLYGYNGSFPGPTFEVKKHELIAVKWLNKLPDRHFLPIDHTIHDNHHVDGVKTVVHLHGAKTPADSDGYPEAWFTKDFKETGPYFKSEISEYPNDQDATALWYHDHAMAITRLNIYAGLVGLYFIRDREEQSLNLPKKEYEIPLFIQDKSFREDGSLLYPRQPNNNTSVNLPDPSIIPSFCGDTILVNGKVWPYAEVEPRKYRFRILNGSNRRIYELYFDSGLIFQQIGSDGGLLNHPVKAQSLTIAPAERCDVIVDFSNIEGKTITLKNRLGCGAQEADSDRDAYIMQFRVLKPLKSKDMSTIPKVLRKRPYFDKQQVHTIRKLTLGANSDQYGRPVFLLNNKRWSDPVTEKPGLGKTEIWSIINTGRGIHPIHLHLVQFRILDSRPFDMDRFRENRELVFTGPATPPPPNERGLKDTVKVPPRSVTRIMANFSPYSGKYVWHCHILEHEDYDMMRPLDIIKTHHR